MSRRTPIALTAIALAGCSSAAGASFPDDAGTTTAGGDASPAQTSPTDAGGVASPGRDSGSVLPIDAGGAIDASGGAPYDGPAPLFVYGPPSGSSGLPGILASVQIVTVTWESDSEDIATDIATAFGAPGIGGTAWWGALSRYCVPGSTVCIGNSVTVTATHVGDPPGLPFVDSAIAQSSKDSFPRFIDDKSQPGTGGKPADLPAPVTASTLYVFFLPLSLAATSEAPALPQGFAVTVDGASSCGYHSATTVGTAATGVAYVVVPRCQVAGESDADVAIATAFREVADAVTDPFRAEGRLGYNDPSPGASAFEIGDFCTAMTGTGQGIAGFSVPEVWSNATMSCAP
jgi:hypothetical protein